MVFLVEEDAVEGSRVRPLRRPSPAQPAQGTSTRHEHADLIRFPSRPTLYERLMRILRMS